MSFFFDRVKKAPPKRGAIPKSLATNANSKETLNRLGCKACPLDKATLCTPKMLPRLEKNCDIYFLGSGPSKVDDSAGKPFSDKAAGILHQCVPSSVHCCYDNVIRDFDSDRKSPAWIAMECCRSLVTESIERAKPAIIVGLGINALQWMLGSSDMIGLRGRVFAVRVGKHECWFMPTYEPRFIMTQAFEGQDPTRSKLGHCLKFDVARAVQVARSGDVPHFFTVQAARAAVQAFSGAPRSQLATVLKLISEARKAPVKAVDIETNRLRPYAAGAKILTCAISTDAADFAFALDHPKAGWNAADKKAIRYALSDLLADQTTIVAHNAPFEIEWLVNDLGKEYIFHDVWECTMMQAHFLDERRGKRGGNDEQFQPNPYQALDFLIKQYFGLSYKGEYRLDRKNMEQADLGETLLYNGADTRFTLALYKLQTKLLKQRGLLDAYQEAKERQPAVALMQALGIHIDQATNRQFAKRLSDEIAAIEKDIFAIKDVQRFIQDNKSFNPASGPDTIKIFRDYVGVGKKLLNAQGKESTDKNTLAKIDHPLAKLLEPHRNRSKLKSTYVDPFELGRGVFIWPDGKMHPSFNTTFAETGRTSSDEPNQQNWPSRNDKWVRKQVTAAPGNVLVAFDYGQLEACTAAMCSRDKTLVAALWDDYDIHMEWAHKIAERYPAIIGGRANQKDPAVMKKFRSLVKNKMVFPVMFGASNVSVAGYLGMPVDVIDKIMAEFWKSFFGLYNWQKRLMKDYYDTGYVESPTGRRRHYPLTKNQAINYPIQSLGCDIVCRSMVSLSAYAAQTGKWYLHPIMNIHDDLTFEIPDNEKVLESAIDKIYRTMLAPAYDFINVPLSVSCSIGHNWLEMDEIGKFWSHKDL